MKYQRWLTSHTEETLALDEALRPAGHEHYITRHTVVQHLLVAHQRLAFAKGLHNQFGALSWVYELPLETASALFERNVATIQRIFLGKTALQL